MIPFSMKKMFLKTRPESERRNSAFLARAAWGRAVLLPLLVWGLLLPASAAASEPSRALNFAGANQHVAVPDPADFNLPSGFTVEAWVYVNAFDKTSQAIVTKGESWGLMRNGSTSQVTFRTRSGNTVHDLTTDVLQLRRWYHIAGVYDGQTKFIYVDGKLVRQAPYSAPVNPTPFPLHFGNNAESSNRLFNGRLDGVRIWRVARSTVEIETDWQRHVRPDEPGLLGDWRFDEPSGTVAFDSSIGQRHGTLMNMTAADRIAGNHVFRDPPPLARVPKSAIRFEGDERQFIRVQPRFLPAFALQQSLTLEAWVNVSTFDLPSQTILSLNFASGSSSAFWGVRLGGSRKLAFSTTVNGVSDDLESSFPLLANRWYHVAAVFTGTHKVLYLDGVERGRKAYTEAVTGTAASVVFGGDPLTPNRAFHGRMDLARVWNVVRSPEAIDGSHLRELRGDEAGLLGEWRFNEQAGPDALDSSFAERSATLINFTESNRVDGLDLAIAAPPAAAQANEALKFSSASDSKVTIPETSGHFTLPEAFTIETWVKLDPASGTEEILMQQGADWVLGRTADGGKLFFNVTMANQSLSELESQGILQTNRWYHVAAVFDGSLHRLYLDGVLDASRLAAFPPLSTGSAVTFGPFEGCLETTRIWSLGRTAEQIRRHADRDLRGSEAGLLGDWRFNDPSPDPGSDQVNDSSRHGIAGVRGGGVSRADGLQFRPPARGELALEFNNADPSAPQYATLPVIEALQVSGPLTIEFWVRVKDQPTANVPVVSAGADAWEVLLTQSGQIEFNSGTALLSTSSVQLNTWHHVAIVCEPDAVTFYLDGRPDIQHKVTGSPSATSGSIHLAARQSTGGDATVRFSGFLDELRLWRGVRDEESVRENVSRALNGTEPFLLGEWRFNEGSGDTLWNTRWNGGGLEGTLHGLLAWSRVEGVPLGVPLPPQATLAFDGMDDFVEIPHHAALNLPASLPGSATLEAWVRPAPSTDWRAILFKGAEGYNLVIDPNNFLRFMTSPVPANALSSSRALAFDKWQHVAVVLDGAANRTTFYIDGQPAGSHAGCVIRNNSDSLFLGKRGGAADPAMFYKGALDEVRIWTYARTPLEIQFYAFQTLPYNTANLALHLPMNEGSGGTLQDATLNQLTGTLKGMDHSIAWNQGQSWDAPALPSDIRLGPLNPAAAGLWVGQVTLHSVNEVQKTGFGAAAAPSPTRSTVGLRLLLHVNAQGHVSLLKDVTVMETRVDPANPNSERVLVLVTDPRRLPEFEGVATRFGKKVGIRYGSVSYDFPGHNLPLLGTLAPGRGCLGIIDLPADFPTNPFMHRYHNDHRTGFALSRQIALSFEGNDGSSLPPGPGYGVDQIRGTYRETITGLHKVPLRIAGTVVLDRVSQVDQLNHRP